MLECYKLDKEIKNLAIANDFVLKTNQACLTLGQNLQPFCMYANETQRSHGVIDFATFQGFANQNISLVDEIANERKDVFKDFGLVVNINDPLNKKLLFYDYLMTIAVCYVEVPKYTTRDGRPTATFDKYLCTRNPYLMAEWMGSSVAEMQSKYSSRIIGRQSDFDNNEMRFVKLTNSNKGNGITVPRSAVSVEKMTCIPMYMLQSFVEGFKPLIDDGIVRFSYLKDNGTIRNMDVTLNSKILLDVYKDNLFVGAMLSGVDINKQTQGGMQMSSKANRGYIKVPELGASTFDGTGVRSLNIARLLKAEKITIDNVDLSFIHVDLNSVIGNFEDSLDYAFKHNPNSIKDIYRALIGEEPKSEQTVVVNNDLVSWVNGRSAVLSTTFHRALHSFMASNPQWFPLYTGKPNQRVTSSANYGVETMDF